MVCGASIDCGNCLEGYYCSGGSCVLGSKKIYTYTIDEDTPINITLNSTIVGNWTRILGPSYGSIKNLTSLTNVDFINITYTPVLNYNGEDYFEYNISNGVDFEIIGVNVTIKPVDDAPILQVGNINFGVFDSTPIEKTYYIPVKEVDGDALNYSCNGCGKLAGASFNSQTGELKWTISNANIENYIDITFTITDLTDNKFSSTKTVNVSVTQAHVYYLDAFNGNDDWDGLYDADQGDGISISNFYEIYNKTNG